MKGNRKIPWKDSMWEYLRMKGVACLHNDLWCTATVEFRCDSSRLLWIKLSFVVFKVDVVIVYGPTEGDAERREKFWRVFG